MKIPNMAVRKPVAFTCLLVAILLIGAMALQNLSIDMLPKMDIPQITILTVWNGASPSDIEQRVTKTMEDNMSSIEGIKDMTSKSLNNVSAVTLEFEWGTDLDVRMGDVRDKLDLAKRDLPEDIEEPMLFRMSTSNIPIMASVITAEESFPGLYKFVDDTLKEQIQRVAGVGNVMVMGGLQREISVMLDPSKLEAYKLSTQEIVNAIERENINMPAGSLKDGATNYSVRMPARFQNIADMETVIVASRGGMPIYLRDVASIRDNFKEQNEFSWSADPKNPPRESIILIVFKNNDANAVDVITRVGRRIDAMMHRFPADAHYQIFFSQADEINNSIRSLTSTLFEGLVLVFVITWLFMKRFWASVIVCISIPVSLLMTCIVMWLLGYSMNVFTLMALAMAVGLVVDNAVVSMDQIMHHMELGERKDIASMLGASEVGGALIGSTSTSVVVLMPLFFIGGMVGVFFSSLGAVMVSSLFCSFLVAISFVPMLASRMRSVKEDNLFIHRWSEKFLRWLERAFRNILDWSLDHKLVVLGAAVLFMVFTVKGFGYIGTELTPETDSGRIEVAFQLPQGTRVEETDALVRDIMEWVRANVPELLYMYGEDGEDDSGFDAIFGDDGANVGSVSLRVTEKKYRTRSSFEIAQQIRDMLATKQTFQSVNVTVESSMSPESGKPLVV
ncbi:efflux RND transporter permease subunit, partial [Synergistaceae bacterium OttesenSCG-928-I11]|nr:efflux RND transporter permease subunit [Synergistaceae bacterium OttesenSCG-928-I11]